MKHIRNPSTLEAKRGGFLGNVSLGYLMIAYIINEYYYNAMRFNFFEPGRVSILLTESLNVDKVIMGKGVS